MRQTTIICALLLCTSLFADETGRWRISVLASEISNSAQSARWDEPHAGVSLGLAFAPTPQWDIEGTVALQTHISPYWRLFKDASVPASVDPYRVFEYHEYRVTPIDVALTRHFLAGGRVEPYVRAGLRYVDAPDNEKVQAVVSVDPFSIPVIELPGGGYEFNNRTSAQAGAGVRLRVTEHASLRAEVNRLLRSSATDFDPLTRFGLGVSWSF